MKLKPNVQAGLGPELAEQVAADLNALSSETLTAAARFRLTRIKNALGEKSEPEGEVEPL